jgi:hypothetical protein
MNYGSPHDSNLWRLIKFMRLLPIIPAYGDRKYLQRPIYMDDFFDGNSQLPESRRRQRQEWQPRGEFPQRYNEVIETITKKMNKFVWKLHILSKLVLGILKHFKKNISQSRLQSEVGLTAEP